MEDVHIWKGDQARLSSAMLHELLMAMSGRPGDIFCPLPSAAEATTFAVRSDMDILYLPERLALNKLSHLGWVYSQLQAFIARVRAANKHIKEPSDSSLRGHYLQAFASALEGSLQEYERDVCKGEAAVLDPTLSDKPGQIPLAYLASSFSKWELALPALLATCTEIEHGQWKGSTLIDVVYTSARTGIEDVKQLLEPAVKALFRLLWSQVSSWILYGRLIDPHYEFFIEHRFDINKRDNTLLVNEALLPRFIPMDVANNILFIGRAVFISKQMTNTISTGSPRSHMSLPTQLTQQHQKLLVDASKAILTPPFVFLQGVHVIHLHDTFYTIRLSVADWLSQEFLVKDGGIQSYLSVFRSNFLIGDSNLATDLIDFFEERTECQTSPSSEHVSPHFTDYELTDALSQYNTSERSKFSLVNIHPDRNTSSSAESCSFFHLGHHPVRLRYSINWPLFLFITEADIEAFGDMWSFLMLWKAIQRRLTRHWHVRESICDNRDQARDIWRLRNRMVSFLDTFWTYLQMDVVDKQFRVLTEKISPAPPLKRGEPDGDSSMSSDSSTQSFAFEHIESSIGDFLSTVKQASFLHDSPCLESLLKISECCSNFHQHVLLPLNRSNLSEGDMQVDGAASSATSTASRAHATSVSLEGTFLEVTNALFAHLTRMTTKVNDESVNITMVTAAEKLLSRLDCSRWYSVGHQRRT
ncbi:hypothetical protein BZG36_03915 [Bifiguratus adelaidae]|uniref:Spindle pole body component n=1 Tax=Bifiguratus adelaidae TaxID=1938954 RepID=A0A261XXL7_9FUNG|nr:hypothetical protein BZG36_03915 [Bifiguratus adelaidae]